MEPTEVLRCVFLGSKPILRRVVEVGGGWVRAMSIDDCCVRGPFPHGLTFYGAHGEVIVGDSWENCSHTQRTAQYPCLR